MKSSSRKRCLTLLQTQGHPLWLRPKSLTCSNRNSLRIKSYRGKRILKRSLKIWRLLRQTLGSRNLLQPWKSLHLIWERISLRCDCLTFLQIWWSLTHAKPLLYLHSSTIGRRFHHLPKSAMINALMISSLSLEIHKRGTTILKQWKESSQVGMEANLVRPIWCRFPLQKAQQWNL